MGFGLGLDNLSWLSPGLTTGPHLAHGQAAAPGGLAAAEKVMVTIS